MNKLFVHQLTELQNTKDKEYWARLWEMRVGKSLPTALEARYNFIQNRINCILVLAPNGVHIGWARKIIPSILEYEIPWDYQDWPSLKEEIIEWSSKKKNQKGFQELLKRSLESKNLIWVCANIESLSNKKKALGEKDLETYLEKLVVRKNVFLIVDESHKLKRTKSLRTKAAIRIAGDCRMRRILTGTPSTNGPFDLWSQFCILSYSIFNCSYLAFKNVFGVFRPMRFTPEDPKNPRKGLFMQLVNYKNLEQLYEIIKPHSSRLTLKDVFEDYTEPIPDKRYFELTPYQRKTYETLRDELMVQLDTGEFISSQQAMVILMRLQQITRGFVGGTQNGEIDLGSPYPALEALEDLVEQAEGKVLIFCKFEKEIDLILSRFNYQPEKDEEGQTLPLAGKYFVRYDGTVSNEERYINVEKLQTDPNCKGLVGNWSANTMGQDMSAADTVISFSHTYNLDDQLQALARVQGVNQKSKVILHVSLVAADTVDEKVIENLEKKVNIAKIITGDYLRDLLRNDK
jgi:SNF2 family DNA or RNA helicase